MKSLLCALVLSACTSTTPDMPRSDACHEQADAWCDVVAPAAPGCWVVYLNWCGMDGVVDGDSQAACLQDVAAMQRDPIYGYPVPDACRATWATP